MNKTKEIVFNDIENTFNDLLEEYDYRMMLAKDEIVSFVLFEMMKHLKLVYDKLSSETNFTKILVEFKEDGDFEMLVETTNADKCICFKSDDISDEETKNYKCMKIYSIEKRKKRLLYEMIFDANMSYIIIQNIDDILVYSIIEDYVVDNTFSDTEMTAILYTLSFIIGSVIDNKPKKCMDHKVIDLAEYKKRKTTK